MFSWSLHFFKTELYTEGHGSNRFSNLPCFVPPLQVCTYPHVHMTWAAALVSLIPSMSNSHKTINDKVIATVWYRQVMKTWALHKYAKTKVDIPRFTHYLQIILVLFVGMLFWILAQVVQNICLSMKSNKFQVTVNTWMFLHCSDSQHCGGHSLLSCSFRTRGIWYSFRADGSEISLKRTVCILHQPLLPAVVTL